MRALVFLLLSCLTPLALAGKVHVAVAANFRHTADLLNQKFQIETGHEVTLSSASTGVLYSQILHGAPFDVFLAADSASPALLEKAGHGVSGRRMCYARGELVLTGGNGSLEDLANPQLSLAIANPGTAPYGRAAAELLSRPQFATAVKRKTVRASNVVQAYQFWHTGSVDLALVARSLAPEQAVAIPVGWYEPIEQQASLLTESHENPAAARYMDFLQSDVARAMIDQAGYGSCN